MSEDARLLEIVRKDLQQFMGVVLVIVVDVGEEVVQQLADIDLSQFAGENGAYPPTKSGSIHPFVSRKSA